MARSNSSAGKQGSAEMSIIGAHMKVVGDLTTEGTVRVEGRVEGDVEAGKAVVLGNGGEIHGDIRTEDSVISGTVRGSVTAGSRLEVQATARIDGEVQARRMQFEEGAILNGTVRMGELDREAREPPSPAVGEPSAATSEAGGEGPEESGGVP